MLGFYEIHLSTFPNGDVIKHILLGKSLTLTMAMLTIAICLR